ncbi:MAG: nuclease [Candidatus Peregrinibacteria bacterium GW2011_GWA2_33_10]|nr:MAG: nuclease [Candidatus Peregrinibacteria bacterium GW2011_GWA2_33_10]KKP40919.1 MAG: hypothetical protein UR30_C0003G0091 [Candidatus Peregrinibacteria bacterium GW2011_GWC2_33_13]
MENNMWNIRNRGEIDVNLEGYYVIGSKSDEKFIFDEYVLKSGESVRVTTNKDAPTFGNDSAIWSNLGETVYLYDENGGLVDSYGW